MSKVIYVAAPYTHSSYSVIKERMLAVNKYCAELLKQEGCAIISPLTQGHAWQEVSDLPHVGTFWLDWCRELLPLCTDIHILMLDGWKESVGVTHELQWAKELNLKIKFI